MEIKENSVLGRYVKIFVVHGGILKISLARSLIE